MRLNEFWQARRELLIKYKLLDLSIVNPDLPIPKKVLELATQTVQEFGINRYPTAKGNKKVLAKILDYWNNLSHSDYTEDEICLTSGTKDSLASFLRVKSVPGQTFWTQDPSYPVYNLIARSFGLNRTQTNPDFIIITSPNNPSGEFLSDKEMGQVEISIKTNSHTWIFFDAVYVPFFGKTVEILNYLRNLTEKLVISFSFSKVFSMAGLRLGSLFGPSDTIEQIVKAKSRLDYGVDIFSAVCGWAMLEQADDFPDYAFEVYSRRYELAKRVLNHHISSESGLPFIWLNLGALDSLKVFDELALRKTLTMPGSVFGEKYRNYLRLSLTAPDTELLTGFKSLSAILEINPNAQAVNF